MTTAKQTTEPAAVKINDEQELYVIPCGNGFTCLGFDVLLQRANAVAAWLNENGTPAVAIDASLRGTLDAYGKYKALMEAGQSLNLRTGKRCPAELTAQLIGFERKRVEVVDRHDNRRRFIVGKSMGWMPCHLEIARSNSSGGPAVMGAPFKSVRVVR
jgi:hypothetical protein